MSKSNFDASASMQGYVYQIRFALLEALRKLDNVIDSQNWQISIEFLDDVAFEKNDEADTLIQTKLHSKPGNLTDRSADLWKTVRVWVEQYISDEIELGKVQLNLVTTQALPDNTICKYLVSGAARDVNKALETMKKICEETTNEGNQAGYNAFKSLSDEEQYSLLESVSVIGDADGLIDLQALLERKARSTVPKVAVKAYLQRLEGVWFQWCIASLESDSKETIRLEDLESLIDFLRPEYSENNLPAEFADALPESIDLESDNRAFVEQLRYFQAPLSMLEHAVKNFYRATEQRTKWSSDGLLNPGELSAYDARLIETWEEKKSFIELKQDIDNNESKRRFAAQLYEECITNGVVPIRPDFIEQYVSKGSYHILSDNVAITWHPDFAHAAANEESA